MKIALVGYGKMGKAIEELALAKGMEIVLRIGSGNLTDLNESNLQLCEVAIEFSTPVTAFENIKICLDAGVPVISGTTGWLDHFSEITEYCTQKKGSFLYASNFSIGVNILFDLNKRLASIMNNYPEYVPSIEEIHHTQKKDSPSGTAITLAEQILEKNKNLTKWITDGERKNNELMITSERTDPAPGTHHVLYSSAIDNLEIIHTAHTRTGFASGALIAAEYIATRKGIFTMKDVLGF